MSYQTIKIVVRHCHSSLTTYVYKTMKSFSAGFCIISVINYYHAVIKTVNGIIYIDNNTWQNLITCG